VAFIQGDHLSGKPGNVRKFETCLFKSTMPIWCYLSWAWFKSGFTPKFGVMFGVSPEFTLDFRYYLGCNTRNLA